MDEETVGVLKKSFNQLDKDLINIAVQENYKGKEERGHPVS